MSLWDRLRGRRGGTDVPQPSSETSTETEHVVGERGESAVQRPPSLQSRLSNFLAIGLLGTIGIGFLAWYCAHSMSTRSAERRAAESAAQDKAKGDVSIRPLGRVDPPANSMLGDLLGPAPEEPPPEDIPTAWLAPAEDPPQSTYAPIGSRPTKSPEDERQARLLAGPAFASVKTSSVSAAAGENESAGGGDLDSLLRPGVTQAASAKILPTQRLLLPKGAFLDCTLETAIDSTLPGMTTCVLATDTFSADGSVVLLERGTKLVGETRGQVRRGAARLFVLWTEARTPMGVVVPLASPGTDELGRSGLPGAVNSHFWDRFGAAILISVIDGAIQAAVAAQQDGDGSAIVVNPATTENIVTEVLKSTVNIPPTIVKPQGDRIQILVARDLDFRSVYELHPIAAGR